ARRAARPNPPGPTRLRTSGSRVADRTADARKKRAPRRRGGCVAEVPRMKRCLGAQRSATAGASLLGAQTPRRQRWTRAVCELCAPPLTRLDHCLVVGATG